MKVVIGFIFALIIGLIVDLIRTVFVWAILNIVGVPFLDALSFWQVFGLIIAFGIATMKVNTD